MNDVPTRSSRTSRDQGVGALVSGLLEDSAIEFEDRGSIWSALNDFIDARSGTAAARHPRDVDFADTLIVNKARSTIVARGKRYNGTFTFDRAALSVDGTREA